MHIRRKISAPSSPRYYLFSYASLDYKAEKRVTTEKETYSAGSIYFRILVAQNVCK